MIENIEKLMENIEKLIENIESIEDSSLLAMYVHKSPPCISTGGLKTWRTSLLLVWPIDSW